MSVKVLKIVSLGEFLLISGLERRAILWHRIACVMSLNWSL